MNNEGVLLAPVAANESETESNYASATPHFLRPFTSPVALTMIPRKPQPALFGEVSPGWFVRQPIVLDIETDGDLFIVSDRVIGVYGDGDTLSGAIRDYIESLIEYHQILSSHAGQDAPTAALLRHVKFYIQPS